MADGTREQPILWLGLAGFDADQRSRLADILQARDGHVRWQFSAFGDADAWIIHGAKVQVVPGATINIHPAIPTQRITRLSLLDVAKPLAMARPLPLSVGVSLSFDLDDRASTIAAIVVLEQQLRPLRARLALARDIIRRGAKLRHGIYHVSRDGRLLAAMNFRKGVAGLSPDLQPHELAGAAWDRLPVTSDTMPPMFEVVPVNQLSWTYVLHTDVGLLPPSYMHRLIYYRGAPRVPANWLTDTQLALLHMLATRAATFEALAERTGVADEQLEKDLTCLYFASAITSTPSKAAHPASVPREEHGPSVTPLADLVPAPGETTGRMHTVPLYTDSFRASQAPDSGQA
ncbi:MAG TPA: hypothetical protein VFE82_17555 [Ramlibacter sp.]|jgi:hypothetical protein|uniref:hypothetical protein n=1 Tax=Ramlibacter sp. TaxID=1917967 RepID=UPI002D381262|nr:hypothetical protein [Ramlibacter sp.]HZY20281.1 hypothetical protein [Ramlibacter sp.]